MWIFVAARYEDAGNGRLGPFNRLMNRFLQGKHVGPTIAFFAPGRYRQKHKNSQRSQESRSAHGLVPRRAHHRGRRGKGRFYVCTALPRGFPVFPGEQGRSGGRYDRKEVYNLAVVKLPYYSVGGQDILVHNTGREWWESIKRLFGFGKRTVPDPRSLTSEQVRVVESARQVCRGDCEHAAEVLRQILPGGTKRRFAGERLLHEVYEHQGKVYDVTAKQYIRPDVWTQEELAHAGLAEAIESGVFTAEQHKTFMTKIIRILGGVED